MGKPALLCIGHRGAMGHAPENTLSSVHKAIALGALCIEVDVYFVDNHLVIFHDDRLERTTNGVGLLSAQSFAYLRSLDAGEGQQIPTLEEVCEVIKDKACLNIELKGAGTAVPVAAFVLRLLTEGWNLGSFLISSFQKRELRMMKRLIPEIKIGVLVNGAPIDDVKLGDAKFAEDIGAFSVHPSSGFVTQAFVDDAHNRCLRVYVYGIEQSADADRMYQLGADGVFTDFPETVIEHYAQGGVSTRWCER